MAVFGLTMGAVLDLRDPAEVRGPNDPALYWRMANGKVVSAPFGFRVLAPTFVRVLPLNHHLGFALVTATSGSVLALALWAWLRRHATRIASLAAVAVVFASSPVWTQIRSPYRNDLTMMACLAVAALAADGRRWGLFAVAGVAAVATRDAAVIAAVVPLVAVVQDRDRRALLALGSVVGAFLVIRGFVPVIPRPLQDPAEILRWRAALDGGLLAAVLVAIGSSFGAAWAFVVSGWSFMDSMSRRWALVAAASVPTLLIASDWSRLLAPAFLIVAMGAAVSRLNPAVVFGVAVLLAITNVAPFSLALAVGALIGGLALVLWASRTSGNRPLPAPGLDAASSV